VGSNADPANAANAGKYTPRRARMRETNQRPNNKFVSNFRSNFRPSPRRLMQPKSQQIPNPSHVFNVFWEIGLDWASLGPDWASLLGD
jgi:hypothetical protein